MAADVTAVRNAERNLGVKQHLSAGLYKCSIQSQPYFSGCCGAALQRSKKAELDVAWRHMVWWKVSLPIHGTGLE